MRRKHPISLRDHKKMGEPPPPRPGQISLKRILLVVTLIAISLGIIRANESTMRKWLLQLHEESLKTPLEKRLPNGTIVDWLR